MLCIPGLTPASNSLLGVNDFIKLGRIKAINVLAAACAPEEFVKSPTRIPIKKAETNKSHLGVSKAKSRINKMYN